MGFLEAAILVLVALILAPGFSFYFDVTPKIVVILTGTAALLLLEILRARTKPEPVTEKRNSLWFFGVLIACSAGSLALSTLFSARPGLSIFGGNWRRFGAVTQISVLLFAWLAARNTAGRPVQARTLLRGMTASGCVAGAYGIAQYFGWDPLLARNAYHVGEGIWTIVRPPGTLGYVSYFATWMLVTVYVSMLSMRMEQSRWWRRVAQAAAVIGTVSVVLSGTRAALAGLIAGGGIMLLMSGWRPRRRSLAVAMLCAVLLTGFYFSPAGQNLRSRTRWFAEDPFGGARITLWRDSLRMGLERPLAGFGPEVFTSAFTGFESRQLAAEYPDFAHESPHNILLDAFVAQGLPGIAILGGFVLLGWQALRSLRRRNPALAAPLAAALAAGVVSQQFTSFTAPTAVILFTALGLAVGLCSEAPTTQTRWAAVPWTVVSAALLVVAFRLAASDHSLAVTESALAVRDWDRASSAFNAYQRVRLPGGTADLWYSRAVLAALGKESDPVKRLRAFGSGMAAARAAAATAEDPFNAWYNAAAYYSTQNDPESTERCLRLSIRSHPTWFKPHWALARLLWLESRAGEAEQEARLARELDRDRDQEVTRTLGEILAQRTVLLQK
jgi:O-antigen ligase